MTSSPAFKASCRRVAVFGSVMCSTVAPPVAASVRDHEAVEPPVAFQHLGEQPLVLRRRRAVDRVVGGHNRARALVDRGHERRKEKLVEQALAEVDRIAVAAAFADVREKCFGVVTTPARSNGATKARAIAEQQRIFAVRLFTRPHRTSSAMLITGDRT